MLEWTAQTAVIAAVLAGAVALACRTRRIGPVAKHALWTVVLVKLLLPPMFVVRMPWRTPPSWAPAISEAPAAERSFDPPDAIVQAADRIEPGLPSPYTDGPCNGDACLAQTVAWRPPIWSIAIGVWLFGALIFFSVQMTRVVRLGRRVRTSADADPALAEDVSNVAGELGLASIETRVVEGLTSPVMWCLRPRHPQLLWPAHLSDDLPPACRRALVVHELAHVKRRDHWIGWVELVAGCAWWWNPMFWYVRGQVRENAELACDGWVIHALPNGRRAYAEALLTICSNRTETMTPMPVLSAGGGSRRVLERRLTMIMKGQIPVRLPRIGVVSVIVLGAIALPAWAQRPFDVAQGRPGTVTTVPQTVTTVTTAEQAVEVQPEPQSRVIVLQPKVATTIQQRSVPRVVVQRTPLPDDAQKLVDKYAEHDAQIRKEAEAKLQEQQSALIKELQAVQESYTKAGKLDEAVAVRDRIRLLETTSQRLSSSLSMPMKSGTVLPTLANRGYALTTRPNILKTPFTTTARANRTLTIARPHFFSGGTLTDLRGHVGETFTIPLVGSVSGEVWGTGTYSDDSSLPAAAVHAGVVENGKLGFVRVTILPGRDKYDGTSSHGVTSQSWNSPHEGSFKLERESSSSPVLQATTLDDLHLWSLPMLRGQNNASLLVEVVGTDDVVWGTDVYTDDSSIGAAAVHAGILKAGEKGVVKVTLLPGRDSYQGSSRNGVRSESFGPWQGSFKIERK